MTWVGRARAALARRYGSIDPRTAGLFRLVLGALLAADCLRHWVEAPLLYSVQGVFPNDRHLARPSSGYLFSLFHAFSSEREVHVIFALGLVCHLLLLVGYRSRLFAALSFVFVTSMDSRIPLVENGGYIVVNLATLYACFLPIERRFSVDAWLLSFRARKETTAAELDDRRHRAALTAPFVSLAPALALFNFALVYFFNVVNKSGNIWRKGDTVHYVLHINRMVTGLAVFVRETFPAVILTATDFLVLSVEAVIFACIIWPRARLFTRPLAMFLIFGLHLSLGTMMRLGPFSWFMIGWSAILLLPVHWAWLERRRLPRGRTCEVGVDEGSPLSVLLGRVITRLDAYERVRFTPGPAGALLALRAEDRWETAPRAVAPRVLEALPFGRSLGAPGAWVLAALERRAAGVTQWLGLSLDARPAPPATAPLAARLARLRGRARELLLFYLGVCFVLQAWFENKAIPKALPPPVKEGQVLQPHELRGLEVIKGLLGGRTITLKPEPTPRFLQVTITYPRLFQGWGMFAPNPIQDDGVLAIDAYTVDGRRIDPFTGRAPDLDLTDSRGEGLSQLRQDYANRIRLDRNQIYREDLREYLTRWHLLTRRPADELVAFDVYWVRAKCPKPGEREPTNGEAVALLTWRKPGYRRPPELSPLPPTPTVRSADKWEEK